jgi:hypothetical protein
MENFARLASGLSTAPLINAIWGQPHLWRELTARQTTPGSPHKDTETIFLRWSESQTIHAVFNDLEAVDYPALEKLSQAKPLIEYLLRAVEGDELGRVIITKLRPGGVIDPHIDEGAYADHFERFHIPLLSNAGSWFTVFSSPDTAEAVRMNEGELWWFNHKREHTYVNTGDTHRIHLIVDCVSPKWRRERDAA